MYFKVLNKDMKSTYRKFQYHIGLNVDTNPFDNEPCQNGLHFSDENGIIIYLAYTADLIAEVEIPENQDYISFDNQYKAHSIIIKNVRPLWEASTFEWLIENNVKLALLPVIENNMMNILKTILDKDIINKDEYLVCSAIMRKPTILKMLIDRGADIHTDNDYILRHLVQDNRNKYIIKAVLDNGADIHVMDDEPLFYSLRHKNYDMAKLLLENGANVHARNNEALYEFAYWNREDEQIRKLLKQYS